MPGPAPTPTAMLKLRGSSRANRRKGEPQPQSGQPKCPKSLNAAAREVWRKLVKVMAPGVVTKDNGLVIERYCHSVARWQALATWLDTHDATYSTDTGVIRVHPNVRLLAQLDEQLLRVEQQLGLTPAARTRVTVVPTAPDRLSVRQRERFFPSISYDGERNTA